MANTDHITKEWFDGNVRQTEDGKASVLDLIRNAIVGRGERQVWQRLKEQNPELEELVSSVRFSDACGHLQKTPTPVADLEGWLQILALLPGTAGKKYRQTTAEIMVRIWRGDADLGLAIMLRDTNKVRSARAEARLRVAGFNKRVTEAAMENNERPDFVHNARYVGFYLMSTGKVRHQMGIQRKDTPLDYMGSGELAIHETIQHIALKGVEAKGGTLQDYVSKTARYLSLGVESITGSPPVPPRATEVGYMDLKDARAIQASDLAGQGTLF